MRPALLIALLLCTATGAAGALSGFDAAVLEKLAVGPQPAANGFPVGFADSLKEDLITDLRRVFGQVRVSAEDAGRTVLVSGAVVEFVKAVPPGFLFPYRLKVRLVFRNAQTGEEVLKLEALVKHRDGGEPEYLRHLKAKVLERLLEDMKRNRR